MTHYETIRKEIAMDFGLEAGGYAPKTKYNLTLRQCQILNNKYGFDKAMIIVKRYRSLFVTN